MPDYKYCINGRFMTRNVTGVDRYAREIVRELDRVLKHGEARLAIPENAALIEPWDMDSIEIVRVGGRTGHMWEQIDYSNYLRKTGTLGLSLCNTAPVRNPGIVCIHDMSIRANPGFYSKRFVALYRVLFHFLTKRAKAIVTVSQFSKSEIEKYYPGVRGKVEVVPDAWQHIARVETDGDIFEKHPDLLRRGYYFAMSSLAPNKNLKWIAETARLNPDDTFVVAGGINAKVFGGHDIPQAENVVYLGYVSDGEAKALMENCEAFLYPTFYEGFGIPPMEALASGASIVVSDTEVMHEIYDDTAAYINPTTPEKNLRSMKFEQVGDVEKCLNQYSWSKSAKIIKSFMEASA